MKRDWCSDVVAVRIQCDLCAHCVGIMREEYPQAARYLFLEQTLFFLHKEFRESVVSGGEGEVNPWKPRDEIGHMC